MWSAASKDFSKNDHFVLKTTKKKPKTKRSLFLKYYFFSSMLGPKIYNPKVFSSEHFFKNVTIIANFNSIIAFL